MAEINISNLGGGGGGTLSLTTTGTGGASTLVGNTLNIPTYQGQITLTTTGTSGASSLVGNTLNIPQYQGSISLTTTGTSGAATLVGNTLNVPQYATAPAGSAGQVQFNSTPAGSFAASANLEWDDTATQLNIGAPSSPTGKLNVKGSGTTSATVNTRLTDSGNTELLKVLDNGSTNIGANFNWDNVNGRLGLGTSTPNQTLEVSGAMRLTGTAGTAAFMLGRNSAGDVSTVTLGTTGTSGAATLSANVLNIPQYQGALTLTTTGTSGAATLVGTILNIPQYSGGGGTPAGSTGQIQYNNVGAFGASANLAWDNTNTRLNLNAPTSPTAVLNVRGTGSLSGTSSAVFSNSNDSEVLKIRNDNYVAVNKTIAIGDPTTYGEAYILGNGASSGGTNSIKIVPAPTNSFPIIEMFNTGTNSTLPSIILNAGNISSSGQHVLFMGRGGFSGLSSNVAYLGALVSGAVNSNSLHLGFNVSNSLLNRFQAMQIWNSGNVVMQNGGAYTDSGYKLDIISASSTHALRVRAPNTNSGTDALLVQNSTPADLYRIEANGKITYLATNTAAGTTGAQTINRPSGTVNFAAGASSLVVTNSLCTTSSIVFATVRTNDATAYIKNVVPSAGSFTINLVAAATVETSVGFFIIN